MILLASQGWQAPVHDSKSRADRPAADGCAAASARAIPMLRPAFSMQIVELHEQVAALALAQKRKFFAGCNGEVFACGGVELGRHRVIVEEIAHPGFVQLGHQLFALLVAQRSEAALAGVDLARQLVELLRSGRRLECMGSVAGIHCLSWLLCE